MHINATSIEVPCTDIERKKVNKWIVVGIIHNGQQNNIPTITDGTMERLMDNVFFDQWKIKRSKKLQDLELWIQVNLSEITQLANFDLKACSINFKPN